MKKIIGLLLVLLATANIVKAGNPPRLLRFVESDSIVVWGDDKCDFRSAAMAAAPRVVCRTITAKADEVKQVAAWIKQWQDVLSSVDALGRFVEREDAESIVPTCNWMKMAGKLFLHTADAHYMNMVERTAYNTLLPMVDKQGPLSFEKNMAAQALVNTAGMMYATDAAGIYVNFYANSSSHIKTADFDVVIDQLTGMPHANRVKLRIGGRIKGQQKLVLRLRMPDWCYGNLSGLLNYQISGVPTKLPVVYVNGREEFYQMEKGYLVINRKWNRGDEVYFDFPFEMSRLAMRQSPEIFMLQCGPLVYGTKDNVMGARWTSASKAELLEEPGAFGHLCFSACVQMPDGTPKTIELQAVADGFPSCWFTAMKP